MIVDLGELRLKNEPLEVEFRFSENDLSISSQIAVLQEVGFSRIRVTVSEDTARVKGQLTTNLSLKCCRCMHNFGMHLEKDFDLDYVPDPEPSKEGEEFELTYNDLDVGFFRNDQLDLTTVVSEQIVLEIPMKPVCRDECRGLCDQCGADLNVAECSCDRDVFDQRLAALTRIKKRMTEKKES